MELKHHGIKGQRWGVRRYQNSDGTLTNAGKRRYERDAREKEFNKYDPSTNKYYKQSKKNGRTDLEVDANRYVKEDISRSKKIMDETSNMTRTLKNANDTLIKNKSKPRMDLSKMSDQELRNQLNRELLERQYNDMFNAPKVSKGREYAKKVLDTAGSILAVGSSALAIALSIKELKG